MYTRTITSFRSHVSVRENTRCGRCGMRARSWPSRSGETTCEWLSPSTSKHAGVKSCDFERKRRYSLSSRDSLCIPCLVCFCIPAKKKSEKEIDNSRGKTQTTGKNFSARRRRGFRFRRVLRVVHPSILVIGYNTLNM